MAHLLLHNDGMEADEVNSSLENKETSNSSSLPFFKQHKWWFQMAIYTFFVLAGQSTGTLLGRVYFSDGGNSKWMGTLVQVVGFPVPFPFLWFTTKKEDYTEQNTNQKLNRVLVSVYVSLGILLAATCMLYTIGIQYLPVTTYSLICASQLGFNALFSILLNKQKLTPYTINSVVLLSISSILLVFATDPGDSNKTSKKKCIIGFICTIGTSANYALSLSVTQLVCQKIIKRETIRAIIDMCIYQNIVATLIVIIGLFASGEWRKLNKEMDGFNTGRLSYVMNLFGTAVSWQVFTVGSIGLIFKISSLFSNVIGILGMPLAPVLAVVFLHDKMTGLKAMSMFLAIWGFVSYTYQHYLDDLKMKEGNSKDQVSEFSEASNKFQNLRLAIHYEEYIIHIFNCWQYRYIPTWCTK